MILSDVRPIKLKLEALRSINVLLDEFLYNILSAAGSLSTEQLKAGLNKLLPTPVGKEAVLEAEVELKSYWERNTPDAAPTKQDFDLQWSFEVSVQQHGLPDHHGSGFADITTFFSSLD